MKYFVLFFLCLSLHAQIDEVLLRNQELDEEEILIFDNKKEVSKFSSFMKGLLSTAALSIQGLTLDGGLNVLSIQNLTAGLVLRSVLLNSQTIQHHVDKVYSYYSKNLPLGKMKDGQEVKERQSLLNHWSEFKVGGRGVVPLNLLAQTNLDALAFYFNNEVGHKRVLDVISPVNESLEKEDRVIDAILGQLKRGFKASKKISISNDPLKLWEKFPAGSEIKREQDYLFVSSVGLRYGTGILNANTGVFGLYHFFGESSFKVLGDPERKLVKFTIRKLNKKGVGGSASTEMNILLFRIFILDARLNIKFVTTTVEASNYIEHIY